MGCCLTSMVTCCGAYSYPEIAKEEVERVTESMTGILSTGSQMSSQARGRERGQVTLSALYIRHTQKKHSAKASAQLYDWLDKLFFVIPLLLLQAAVAVGTALTLDAATGKTLSGVIAAVSGVLVALQTKMQFGQLSERYSQLSHLHNTLSLKAFRRYVRAVYFYQHTDVVLPIDMRGMDPGTEDEDEQNPLTEYSVHLEIASFLKEAEKMTKQFGDAAVVPPEWIIARYETFRFPLGIQASLEAQGHVTQSQTNRYNAGRATQPGRSAISAAALISKQSEREAQKTRSKQRRGEVRSADLTGGQPREEREYRDSRRHHTRQESTDSLDYDNGPEYGENMPLTRMLDL